MPKKRKACKPDSKSLALTAGEVFAEKIAENPETKEAWGRVSARLLALSEALGSREFIAERESLNADWKKEFGELPPEAVEDFSRWAMRVGWDGDFVRQGKFTPSDLMPYVEGYLLRLQDKSPQKKVDGPYGHCQWRHNGEIVAGAMQPGAWGVCNYLWQTQEKSSDFDCLYEPATGDREETNFDFKSAAQKAKQFFDTADIPWRLSVSERHRTVSLVEK